MRERERASGSPNLPPLALSTFVSSSSYIRRRLEVESEVLWRRLC